MQPRGNLIANARMYAATDVARQHWRNLFAWISERSGVPLEAIDHAAPAPLEDLWSRDDLGLAFICGYPFARGGYALQPVAAPVPSAAWAKGRPVYRSDFIVRADDDIATLADAFGRRIGWTVDHSQSGFNAIRHHLLRYRTASRPTLFSAAIGPLVTPRRVINALLNDEIDVGPLDSFWRALIDAHEPETAAKLRVIESTQPTPAPLLAASASVDAETIAFLRAAILDAETDADARNLLAALQLTGFAPVARQDYDILLAQAETAEAAGYDVPA